VWGLASRPGHFTSETPPGQVSYRYATHNDVSFNDGPHIRRWTHNIIQGVPGGMDKTSYNKAKAVPLQAWSGPEGFQEVKVPRFHDNGTGSW